MKIFPKLLMAIIPLVVFPLIILSFVTTLNGNKTIRELIEKNAELELEFLHKICVTEYETLNTLGLESMEFYLNNAQRNVYSYLDSQDIPGLSLYVLTKNTPENYHPFGEKNTYGVLQRPFEPWDWVLGVDISKDYIDSFARQVRIKTLILLAFILIPVVLVSLLLASIFSRPIMAMEKSALQLSLGRLDARVNIHTKDELEHLGDVFNKMACNVEELVSNQTREIERSMAELKKTQNQLIKRERLANLSNIVAGIAHEINTPIGVSITGATYFFNILDELKSKFDAEELEKKDLEVFMEDSRSIIDLIYQNLKRAGTLVSNFKQLAVDQISEQKRVFNLEEYMWKIIKNLYPQLKKTSVEVLVDIENSMEIYSYPGIFYQIISNLVMNSLIHGFGEKKDGRIYISAEQDVDVLRVIYEDDGKGIDPDIAEKIYEPFVTTRAKEGGSGLGMNIVFNLVNQKLKGTINLVQNPGSGVKFEIEIPWSELVSEGTDV